MNRSGLRIVKCPRRLPPRVTEIIARGREYYYFRETRTKKVRIFGYPYDRAGLPDQAWWSAYRQLAGTENDAARLTLLDLVGRYLGSPEWHTLAPTTQRVRRPLLLKLARRWPARLVTKFAKQHVYAMRDEYAATPGVANTVVRSFSAMLSWAAAHTLIPFNPCLSCRKLILPSRRRYVPWTPEQISLLKLVAPLEIWRVVQAVLSTAQPLHAILALKWTDVDDEGLHFRRDRDIVLPITPRLRALLDGCPRLQAQIFLSPAGRPWTSHTFQAAWTALMKEPELGPLRKAGLVFFGLRRTAITKLVEAGCTEAEVSALTGLTWNSLEPYFKEREQKRLALTGIDRWSKDRKVPMRDDEARPRHRFSLKLAVVTRRFECGKSGR